MEPLPGWTGDAFEDRPQERLRQPRETEEEEQQMEGRTRSMHLDHVFVPTTSEWNSWSGTRPETRTIHSHRAEQHPFSKYTHCTDAVGDLPSPQPGCVFDKDQNKDLLFQSGCHMIPIQTPFSSLFPLRHGMCTLIPVSRFPPTRLKHTPVSTHVPNTDPHFQ